MIFMFFIFGIVMNSGLIKTICLPDIAYNSIKNSEAERLFVSIFKEHEYKLHTLAYKLTKSDQLAQDITQEVFLKLWNNFAKVNEIENIEAWLYRLVENKSIDFLRKVSVDARLKRAIWHNLQEIINDTEQNVVAKEYNGIIRKAIDQLPSQRRIIYLLNRENGLNYNEIAAQLHISRHTVKNQISSALQFIRVFLKNSTLLLLFFL